MLPSSIASINSGVRMTTGWHIVTYYKFLGHIHQQTISPGSKVGRYKLLSILGEGSYGIVYLAEQQRPVSRRVALKVIKPGMDTKQVIARFEAECQALALPDHPNVADVLETLVQLHRKTGDTADAARLQQHAGEIRVRKRVANAPVVKLAESK